MRAKFGVEIGAKSGANQGSWFSMLDNVEMMDLNQEILEDFNMGAVNEEVLQECPTNKACCRSKLSWLIRPKAKENTNPNLDRIQ